MRIPYFLAHWIAFKKYLKMSVSSPLDIISAKCNIISREQHPRPCDTLQERFVVSRFDSPEWERNADPT
jgi:hypothetical protein